MVAGLFLLVVAMCSGDDDERETSSNTNQLVEWTSLAMSNDGHNAVICANSSGGGPRPKEEGGQPLAEPSTQGGGG